MISTRWLEKRRPHWNRLEQLVAVSGRKSVTSLTPAELQELALLYRQSASDLSTVREDPTSKQLALYLNQLLGRAHNLIYMGRRASQRGIWTFYKDTYPGIFRETFPDTFAIPRMPMRSPEGEPGMEIERKVREFIEDSFLFREG